MELIGMIEEMTFTDYLIICMVGGFIMAILKAKRKQ